MGEIGRGARLVLGGFGALLALAGLPLALGGAYLVWLGGSPYYLFAGVMLVASGAAIARRRLIGAWLFGALFAATAGWSVWDAGLHFWPLVARLGAIACAGIVLLVLLPMFPGFSGRRSLPRRLAAAGGAAALATLAFGLVPQEVVRRDFRQSWQGAVSRETQEQGGEWRQYGRTSKGTRYVTAAQITPENVSRLQVAWQFDSHEAPRGLGEDQNTPIYADGVLYSCTPYNTVNALDAETGKPIWTYRGRGRAPIWQRCRGVTHYVPSGAAGEAGKACRARIVMNTNDGRLIELDAATGKPCAGFGNGGTVDLNARIGDTPPAMYIPTSAPTVMKDLVVVGGWIFDGQKVGEPSGVVRAFDARSGELAWAWDMGNANITRLPPEGETYTLGTPNVWSTPAYDLELGLIYLPTGNPTPDFWGGLRRPFDERYGSSVVALDIDTGRERWHFQTVHHDLWDYDVPSQPALYDMPDGRGGVVPALIQLTKQGQIYVLDRRTGQPITRVEERPVPQGAAHGDRLSPTQPFSVGMPQLGVEDITESTMWGITPFDQLYCRIRFRTMRYQGMYTPPNTDRSLMFPSPFGGMNWGSAAIDEGRGILIVNDMRIPRYVQLIPRAQIKPHAVGGAHGAGIFPQEGTPFGVETDNVMSPLGIPCTQPPYGTMTGIDLASRTIVWQVPMGTVEDTYLFDRFRVSLPFPIGMPTVGGAMTTASGLTFFSGTQDFSLRALDTRTGREVWKARLPAGAQMTPMSYVAPSGRQFVVVSVGGARQSPVRASRVIAFALPDAATSGAPR